MYGPRKDTQRDTQKGIQEDAAVSEFVPSSIPGKPVGAGPGLLAGLIDSIRALEELKAAASAAQARAAALFDSITRQEQAAAGLKADQLGKGVGAQIGFARRESPNRGTRLLGLARILTTEMPHTLHALSMGVLSEYQATILVRETACLSLADRQRVDEAVAGNLGELEQLGDRQLIARIKTLSYALDPASVVNRAAHAVSERFVSIRPAPDTMTWVTALLPVAQGVGVFAALTREADRLRAAGDPRSKGQIMAATFVERTTGQARAEDVRVEVQLIMTDRALLAGSAEPAVLPGYGVVPAQFARDLVRDGSGHASGAGESGGAEERAGAGDTAGQTTEPGTVSGASSSKGFGLARESGTRPDTTARTWLRRLYTAPGTNQLVGMDSRARLVPEGMARFIAARDQTCRMPWCGAPIRHYDHIRPVRDGGETSSGNIQGLCEACNQAKEAPGWSARTVDASHAMGAVTAVKAVGGCVSDVRAARTHTIETVTPTGHRYTSAAPEPPGTVKPAAKTPARPGLDSSGRARDGCW